MAYDGFTGEIPELVKARGIVDRATGIEKARASRQWLFDAAKEALGRTDQFMDGHLLVMGLASRAVGLHDGAVHALETDNPFATYTLLRSYAENAAAVLYITDHPTQLHRILGLGDSHPVRVGTITNYAEQGSKRFGSFRSMYEGLSQFAHPMSRSIFASAKNTGDRTLQWRLDPAFKYDADLLVACNLVVELAEANAHLLVEYADAQGWRRRHPPASNRASPS
ncbi:hypothetical protein [Mycobacterium interjectum]|uniref:hypothetical protein n=1 Tax=Mycobacterium interjectum TaxID=33895 RepID=UPI000ACDB809|nr:hypothetical protein [Mycobacterium interjectum]